MSEDPISLEENTDLTVGQQIDAWWETPEGKAHEAKLQRAAERLKERYSHIPFYAERAKNNPRYWRDLASSAVNA